MLARKAAKPAGTTKTRAASQRTTGGKKAACHVQGDDESELDALITVILDDIDAKLMAINADLDRSNAA